MRPVYGLVCGGVRVGVGLPVCVLYLYISGEMLRFQEAKKETQYTQHKWIVAWGEKKNGKEICGSATRWTDLPCAPACAISHDWASTFNLSHPVWFITFELQCMHFHIHKHAQFFNICFFLSFFFFQKMIDGHRFCYIDCMLLWNYIFGAGWTLEGRQIGMTKWEWAQSSVGWIGWLGNGIT